MGESSPPSLEKLAQTEKLFKIASFSMKKFFFKHPPPLIQICTYVSGNF